MRCGDRVDSGSMYIPSASLAVRINAAWTARRGAAIGAVSEDVAAEILDGGTLVLGGERFVLRCESLRVSRLLRSWPWKPGYGIRCDDLVVLASAMSRSLLFIVECKGTIRREGLARDAEGKMLYQLSRTLAKLRRREPTPVKLGGIISIVVNHWSRRITLNVCDAGSSMASEVPDAWLYPGRTPDEL